MAPLYRGEKFMATADEGDKEWGPVSLGVTFFLADVDRGVVPPEDTIDYVAKFRAGVTIGDASVGCMGMATK